VNRDELRAALGEKPRFDIGVGTLGVPIRHFFMTAAVNVLKRRGVSKPRLLEIGCWVGYSTFTWAEALKSCFGPGGTIVCVDPWEDYSFINRTHAGALLETYHAMLASGQTHEIFMHNVSFLRDAATVLPLRGRSAAILPLLRERSFDLVFIDGDHAYDAVRGDIEASLPLLRPGGILCGDDLDLTAAECDLDYARANRDAQPALDPKSGRPFHPGVTLAVKDAFPAVANYQGFWAVSVDERGGATPLELGGIPAFVPRHLGPDAAAHIEKLLRQMV